MFHRKRRAQRCADEDYEEYEEEELEELGSAYSSRSVHQISIVTLSRTTHLAEDIVEVFCPRCDTHLLDYDKASNGFVIVACKKCKRMLGIQMKDTHRRVGFV